MSPNVGRKPSRPFGVTILSVFQFLVGIQFLASALWSLGKSSWAKSEEGVADLTELNIQPKAVADFLFLAGVVCLVLSITAFLLSRGYFRGYEKARRRGRSVAVLGILFVVLLLLLPLPAKLSPDSPLFTIILNLGIFLYLGSSTVKAFFAPQAGD